MLALVAAGAVFLLMTLLMITWAVARSEQDTWTSGKLLVVALQGAGPVIMTTLAVCYGFADLVLRKLRLGGVRIYGLICTALPALVLLIPLAITAPHGMAYYVLFLAPAAATGGIVLGVFRPTNTR